MRWFRRGARRAYTGNDAVEAGAALAAEAVHRQVEHEPRIAKTVVADLSKDGRACFSVDGEPFPWWVSEEGPIARKVKDDLYLVHVVIYCISGEGDVFSHCGLPTEGRWPLPAEGRWPQPVLDGIEFPWYISEYGFTYRSSGNIVPQVELEFFAESVEGVPVTDETELAEDGKVRDAGGFVIAKAAA